MNTSMNAQMNASHGGGMAHGGGMSGHGKMAIEKLINSTKMTHTAVRSGAWSDPRTWQGGRVPGKGANVLIGQGTTVIYDKIGEEDIKTVAIRGKLQFATGRNTQLRVETIINAPEGKLDIGSQSRSVAADKQARIIFTSDRAVNQGWDPEQLTKGLLSHGTVNIFGADKQDKVRLAKNALASDDSLTFKDPLNGWRIGDKIVLAGTSYSHQKSDATNERFRDEVLTITKISGKTVQFTNDDARNAAEKTTLRFDHKKHSKLDANTIDLYAANLSRNVSFETENGKTVPISHRAHVMLMHNPNVKVLNAGFYDLGRSDKSKVVDDVGRNVDGSRGDGKNPRGRYPVHLHQTGLDPNKPVLLRGNAVMGSPGWGIVQHGSNAGLESNVVFDVTGAGIVGESGDEIGWWTDNISIKATGVRSSIAASERNNREKRFDFGFEGDGYWIQGAAQIANTDNVAVSANHVGMSLVSGSLDVDGDFRPIETIAVKDLPPEMRSLFPGLTEVDIRHIPMADITGFENYNSNYGLEVWGHSTDYDGELDFDEPYVAGKTPTAHQGRSLVQNFKSWGNRTGGVSIQYSSNVDFKNGIVAGTDVDSRVSSGSGVFVNHGSYNSVIDGLDINGFKQGVHFEQLPTDKNYNNNTLRNSKVSNSTYNLSKIADEYLNNGRKDDFSAFAELTNNQFESKSNNRAPVARFSAKAVGGLSVKFDASDSFDPDPYVPGEGQPRRSAESKGIAAYGWDVDNNGSLDYFGRTLTHTFNGTGRRTVGLSVLDAQGKVSTTQQAINVNSTSYGNAFIGGDFRAGTPVQKYAWMDNSQWADQGWFLSTQGTVNGGVARLSKVGQWAQHIGQVVRNEGVHKGKQTLSFRLQNIEGSGSKTSTWKNNEITVSLWGVNGQFDNTGWEPTGPEKVGALPMQSTQLISQKYGGPNGDFFDWKNINLGTDLGKGYEYLLFQVNTLRSNDSGDRIAIDNVSLSGKALPSSVSTPVVAAPTKPPTKPPTNPPTKPPANPPTNPPTNPSPPSNSGGGSPTIALGFDEVSGATVTNTAATNSQTNARLQNGASRANGKQGKAATFDGNNDVAFLNGAPGAQLGESDQRTIALWFNADKAKDGGKQVLYEEGHNGKGLNVYLEDGLLYAGGWNRQPKPWNGSWIESSKGKVFSGKWHHVALVLEGTETVQDGALTAYLDGKEIGSTTGMQLGQRPSGIGIGNVVGSTFFEDGSVGRNSKHGFDGRVDNVAIFDNALSAQQVRGLMG